MTLDEYISIVQTPNTLGIPPPPQKKIIGKKTEQDLGSLNTISLAVHLQIGLYGNEGQNVLNQYLMGQQSQYKLIWNPLNPFFLNFMVSLFLSSS